jgi:hypothetical protein
MNGASSFDFAAYKSSRNGLSPLVESFSESDKSETASPMKDPAVRSSYPLYRSTVPASTTLAGGGVGLSNALISGRQKHSDLDNLMGQFNNLMTQLKVPPSTKKASEPVFAANQDYIHLETLRNSHEFLDSSSRLINDNGATQISDANTDRTDTDDHSADDSAAIATIRQLSVRQVQASSTAETGALQSEITAQMMRIYTNNINRDSSPTSSTNGSTPSSPDGRDSRPRNDSYPNNYNSSLATAASAESERFLGYGPRVVESPLRTAGHHLRKTSQDIENRNNYGTEHDNMTADSFTGNQWGGNIQSNLNGQTFPHYFNARHEDEMRQRIEAEERTYDGEYNNDKYHTVERGREKEMESDKDRERNKNRDRGSTVQKHEQYPHTNGSSSSADRHNEFQTHPARTADNLYEHYPISTSDITYVPVRTAHRIKLANMMTDGTDGDTVRASPSRSLIHDDVTVSRNEQHVQYQEQHDSEYDNCPVKTQGSYHNNTHNNTHDNTQHYHQNNSQNQNQNQSQTQDPHFNGRDHESRTYNQPAQYVQQLPPTHHSDRTQDRIPDREKQYVHQYGQNGQEYVHQYDQQSRNEYDHVREEEQDDRERNYRDRAMQRTYDTSNTSHRTYSGESSHSNPPQCDVPDTTPYPLSDRAFGPQTMPPKTGSEGSNYPHSSYSPTGDADRWTGRGNEEREGEREREYIAGGDRHNSQGREGSRERASDRGRDAPDRQTSYADSADDLHRGTHGRHREEDGSSRNVAKSGRIDKNRVEEMISMKTDHYTDSYRGDSEGGGKREAGGGGGGGVEENDTAPPAPPSYLEDFNRLQVG